MSGITNYGSPQQYNYDNTTQGTQGTSQTTNTNRYETGDTSSSAGGTGTVTGHTNAQHPNLPSPLSTIPPPPFYTPDDQQQIVLNYNDLLTATAEKTISTATPPLTDKQQQTLQQSLTTGSPPADATLLSMYTNIVGSTTLAIQAQYELPSGWSIADGNNPESSNWQPNLLGPFNSNQQTTINNSFHAEVDYQVSIAIKNASPPLTAAQIAELKEDIANGVAKEGGDPIVNALFNGVIDDSTTITQAKFFLPPSWTPGTTKASDLTPIASNDISGSEITQMMLDNAGKLASQAMKSVQNLQGLFPADSSNKVAMADFLKAVASAIDNLKKVQQQLQIAEGNITQQLTAAKYSELDGRRIGSEAQLQNQRDQYKKAQEAAHSHSKMAGIMKILGPIVAAVCCIIGAIACIAGGAGTALIVAGIAIGIAMTSYSIADSQLGLSAKFMASFSKFLGDLGSPMKYIVGAVLAIAVAAVLIAATIASPGSGVSIGMQIAANAATQVTLQVGMTMLMASGVLNTIVSDVFGPMLDAMGASGLAKQIVEAVITALIMVVICAKAGGAAAGTAGEEGALQDGSVTFSQAVSNAAADLKQSITDIPSNIATGISNAATSISNAADSMVTSLNNFVAAIKNFLSSGDAVLATAQNAAQDASLDVQNGINGLQDENVSMEETLSDMNLGSFLNEFKAEETDQNAVLAFFKNNPGLVAGTQAGLKMLPQGVDMADNIIQAGYATEIAALVAQLGQIEADLEVVNQMIKMLTKLMNDIQAGIPILAQDVAKCTQFVMNLYNQSGLNKLDSAVQG